MYEYINCLNNIPCTVQYIQQFISYLKNCSLATGKYTTSTTTIPCGNSEENYEYTVYTVYSISKQMSWVESSREKNATKKNNKRDKTCAVSADLARRRPNYAAKSV